jgi:hypothetical protein
MSGIGSSGRLSRGIGAAPGLAPDPVLVVVGLVVDGARAG